MIGRCRTAPAALGLVAAAWIAAGADGAEEARTLPLSSDLRVVVRRGRDLGLEVRATGSEDYRSLAARLLGDAAEAEALEAWNRHRPVEGGAWIHAPLALLSDPMRALVLRSTFPDDAHDGPDWIHRARAGRLPTYDEGLWQVAEWFSGRGERFVELMEANGLSSPELGPGQEVRVPAALLHPAFASRERSADGALEFGTDGDGPFAAYRLLPGEALYSAVVMRFTGRTAAEDVVTLAGRIAERSAIRDPHDIPVAFEVKIPLDLLEPDFLPRGHPRRLEAEQREAEMARELAEQPLAAARAGLAGVLVILDPGHGGRDMGTSHNGVWEHDYVYDVTCRLKQMLQRETSAEVRMTLEDLETGCVPSTTDHLRANLQGTILTAPPFLAREEGEAKIGVNLRWYLANSIYRSEIRADRDPDRVVFLSIHADSRHPSLRGVMVYVPGAAYRGKTYGSSKGVYSRFREVREKPYVSFSKKERVRSEAVSRRLAASIVDRFRAENLPVQPYQPVRSKIIRGRSQFVPAVLRGNAVPGKVLVELVNLGNRDDAALLGSAAQRESLARGLLDALFDHFGEQPPALRATADASGAQAAGRPLDSPSSAP